MILYLKHIKAFGVTMCDLQFNTDSPSYHHKSLFHRCMCEECLPGPKRWIVFRKGIFLRKVSQTPDFLFVASWYSATMLMKQEIPNLSSTWDSTAVVCHPWESFIRYLARCSQISALICIHIVLFCFLWGTSLQDCLILYWFGVFGGISDQEERVKQTNKNAFCKAFTV